MTVFEKVVVFRFIARRYSHVGIFAILQVSRGCQNQALITWSVITLATFKRDVSFQATVICEL